jgi:hypothetical protein
MVERNEDGDVLNAFVLSEQEMAILTIPFPGPGGAQSLFRQLWRLLDRKTGKISLTDEQVGRIFRYARYAEGDGGYEGRLRNSFGRSLAAPFVSEQRSLAL